MVILSARTLTQIRQIRTQVLTDVQDGLSPTTFVAWRKDRPAGTWDNGTEDENWVQVVSGKGILRRNGQDGPVIGEGLIYQQAPYQFRTDRVAGLVPGLRLVVDGVRQFEVQGVTVEDTEKPIVTAWLTEVFGVALPTAPDDEEEVTP